MRCCKSGANVLFPITEHLTFSFKSHDPLKVDICLYIYLFPYLFVDIFIDLSIDLFIYLSFYMDIISLSPAFCYIILI